MLQTGDDAVREWRDHRLRVMGEYSPGGGERERKALSGFWATSGTLLFPKEIGAFRLLCVMKGRIRWNDI